MADTVKTTRTTRAGSMREARETSPTSDTRTRNTTRRAPQPGPQTKALHAERERYLPRGLSTYHPVYPATASGARVVDVDGNTYLDFAGGIGVMNVGHSHPAVVAAIHAQTDAYSHTCAQVLTPPPYIALAKRLTEITPGKFAKKALLINSGAEAIENAIKIARAFTKRPAVITFENSFHGRTNLAMGLTGKVRPYRQNFGPLAADIHA